MASRGSQGTHLSEAIRSTSSDGTISCCEEGSIKERDSSWKIVTRRNHQALVRAVSFTCVPYFHFIHGRSL